MQGDACGGKQKSKRNRKIIPIYPVGQGFAILSLASEDFSISFHPCGAGPFPGEEDEDGCTFFTCHTCLVFVDVGGFVS